MQQSSAINYLGKYVLNVFLAGPFSQLSPPNDAIENVCVRENVMASYYQMSDKPTSNEMDASV